MITLERIRLVGWHYFEDTIIRIGNRCLLAGDNGSGKSTIVDAVQYAMAADLRKARFNTAAGDRKGGRDLAGYVRCKLGSDNAEYLRDDAVSHIMLEFSTDNSLSAGNTAASFTAGACVEAFTDGRLTEHFWIGTNVPLDSVEVSGEGGSPLAFRQFRDLLAARNIEVYDSKKAYLRDFTGRLGVWRRLAEYNPYLEAFTRSVSFTPLISVDKFVCDYILEERPVEITAMKENLESYKEADRQAKAAVLRIEALRKIGDQAAEWRRLLLLLIKMEYLKLNLERDNERQRKMSLEQQISGNEARLQTLEREIDALGGSIFEWENERRETEAALAVNDAHLLYRRLEERIGRLELELMSEQKKADTYELLRSQCEALLARRLSENPEDDLSTTEEGEKENRAAKEEAGRRKDELSRNLNEALRELSDLERGIASYPGGPRTLRKALEEAGIVSQILADVADITSDVWADAVEGWLNTLRFALLVDQADFQHALEVYDSLPRSLGGVYLPNLEKMRRSEGRHTQRKAGSLAELVETESPYARIYLDYILGDVMRADIGSLKSYAKAVTRECMRYSNYTASRIPEDVYRRHYLGQAARKKRQEFLRLETERLRSERDEAASLERKAGEQEEIFRRAYRSILRLAELLPSVQLCEKIRAEKAQCQAELAGIDTAGFRELQEKRDALNRLIRGAEQRRIELNIKLGEIRGAIAGALKSLEETGARLLEKENALTAFSEEHPAEISECTAYAEERIRENNLEEVSVNYEASRKRHETMLSRALTNYHTLVQNYNRDFSALLSVEPEDGAETEKLLNRLETSELPSYREKISEKRADAEKEFKDHFIARLNELIEDARESFHEINETLRMLIFGRDQYRFSLEERSDRKGQIEIIKKAASIPAMEDSLFSRLNDPKELKAAQELFEHILNANLDSQELRSICDYRTYFRYDIKIRDTELLDSSGKPMETSLSKVIREKSGGESQTPYYVAIAASFYRFYKQRPEETIRLVVFDEAFNRMDDERIGKILEFYRSLNLQLITSVPPEKIEAIAPYMEQINLVYRHAHSAKVRDFRHKA
ncbi:MAG: hypothetical protein LBQ88_20065 [Treponema sp.]|jgi:chromosome segregation ATPase|nr:hypothetical protein [Treponema sp.]